MSYAINATNTGWRAINSISDLLPGETYSDIQPVLNVPPPANPFGFITSCKAAVGGVLNANALQKQYPAFELAVMQGVWSDVQTLILDAQSKGILTPSIYTAFQQAAASNNIPITLP